MFIHLKQGLESQPVDWVGCQDKSEPPPVSLLPYGIQCEVQRKLSAVRTDLDSFSDTEAYSLMTSGYRMTEYALRDSPATLGFETQPPAKPENWKFLVVEPDMQVPEGDPRLMRQLGVADMLFLKVWVLIKPLQILAGVLTLALLATLAYLSYRWWSVPLSTTWGQITTALFLLVLSVTAWKPLVQLIDLRNDGPWHDYGGYLPGEAAFEGVRQVVPKTGQALSQGFTVGGFFSLDVRLPP